MTSTERDTGSAKLFRITKVTRTADANFSVLTCLSDQWSLPRMRFYGNREERERAAFVGFNGGSPSDKELGAEASAHAAPAYVHREHGFA